MAVTVEQAEKAYTEALQEVNGLRQQFLKLAEEYPHMVNKMMKLRSRYRIAAKKAGVAVKETWWERGE